MELQLPEKQTSVCVSLKVILMKKLVFKKNSFEVKKQNK
jgi:hypothetical protein